MPTTTKQADVCDRLLGAILSGTYPAGSRLPAERELAEQLETSRGTLREALRKLESLGVVEARRGSGIAVLDFKSSGRVGLIPGFLRHGAPGADPVRVLADLLYMRRVLAREVITLVATRAAPGALGPVRAAIRAAWARRGEPLAFAEADFEAFAALARATSILPLLWILNTYKETVRELIALAGALPAPDDYQDTMLATVDAIAEGRPAAAQAILGSYYERLDRVLLGGEL